MTTLERKVNALCALAMADSPYQREAAMKKLTEALNDRRQPPEPPQVEALANKLLLQCGVPEHLAGHDYLLQAIVATAHEKRMPPLGKELYPRVAQVFDTTPASVDRGIRHAIDTASNQVDPEELTRIFGNSIDPSKRKPTSREFISRIASIVREKMKEDSYGY